MKWKEFGLLALVLAIPFSFYFFNPIIFGADTFYYLDSVCNGTPLTADDPATVFVFSLLPCNFVFLKILLYSLALIALLGVAKTGELLYKKNGWLAGLFVFLNPLFIFGMAQLENENFAIPLLFWANYFAIKAKLSKGKPRWINAGLAVALVGAAGLFWRGSAYYLVSFGLLALPFVLPALVTLFVYGGQLLGNVLPRPGMYEAEFGVALLFLGLNLFTIAGLFLNTAILLIGIYWFVSLILVGKLAINAFPWIAIATLALFNFKPFEKLDIILKCPFWDMIKTILIISCIFMPFVFGYAITVSQPPTQEDLGIVQEWVALQDSGREAKNGFSYGYWIKYYGGEPTAWAGHHVQDFNTGIVLTHLDLNCTMLNESRIMKLFDCG